MKTLLKRSVSTAARFSGLNRLSRQFKKGAVALFWHGVEEKIIDPRVQTLHILFPQFEKQIEYLRQNFEIISLDDFYDGLVGNRRLSPSQVLLTFDDGYQNNARVVAPYLHSLGIPFTVFISTKNIDRGVRFSTYYLRAAIHYTEKKSAQIAGVEHRLDLTTPKSRQTAEKILLQAMITAPQQDVQQMVEDLMELIPSERWPDINGRFSSDASMNWEEAKKIHGLGGTIASHCHDHFICHSNQNQDEVDYQLKTSKRLIENNLGECRYFAYPYGDWNSVTREAIIKVRENEYSLAFMAAKGEILDSIDPLLIPRIGAPSDLDILRFKMNISFIFNKSYLAWSSKFGNSIR